MVIEIETHHFNVSVKFLDNMGKNGAEYNLSYGDSALPDRIGGNRRMGKSSIPINRANSERDICLFSIMRRC